MKTHKKCKGINKAFDFDGCDDMVLAQTRKYGLCQQCYTNWLISDSPMAKKTFDSFLIKNKKDYRDSQKKKTNLKNRILKQQLESKSSLEKKLEKEVNTLVRYIDRGHECISSGRPLTFDPRIFDAGHLFTVKSNPTIRFNLFNIFGQSVHDNRDKSGNEIEYYLRLEIVFGKELQEFVSKLKQTPSIHLTKDELRDKISISRGLVKWIKLQDRKFDLKERITLRNDFNNQLSIYSQKNCEFKL